MLQPTYPGVYIVEKPSGVRTITGVATSITAFLGRTARGPLNRAVRCLSYSDFVRVFGETHPDSDVPQSVRLFFDNGGMDCYVVRLAAGGQPADITLTDIDGNNMLTVTAATDGLWGNGLRLEVDYNTANPDESFNLTVIHLDGLTEVARERHTGLTMDPASPRFAPPFVTQSSTLIDVALHTDAAAGGASDLTVLANSFAGYSQSRPFQTTPIAAFRSFFEGLLTNSPNFVLHINGEGPVPISLSDVLGATSPEIAPGSAWTFLEMATRLDQVINPQLAALFPGLSVSCAWIGPGGTVNPATPSTPTALRITSASGPERSVRVLRATSNDFAGPMHLGVDQGGIEATRYSNFRPVPTASFFLPPATDFGALLMDLAAVPTNTLTSLAIDGLTPVPFDLTPLSPAPADPFFFDLTGTEDGVREKLRFIRDAVNNASGLPWRAELWGYHLAFIALQGSVNETAASVVSAGNAILGGTNVTRNVRQYTLGSTGTSPFQLAGQPGIDGGAPGIPDFEGNEDAQTGFHALDPVDIFNLMVIPGDTGIPPADHQVILGQASIYCQEHRAFLLIDAPASWTVSGRPNVVQNTDLVNDLRAPIVNDYSAVFYPHLHYSAAGLTRTIGPAGAIAGLMARTDAQRGVWKAPAGTEATLRGILGLEVNLTDRENGVLNPLGVNCLRVFPNGFVNWGARTLDGADDFGSEWKYIPIRRLALFIEESLYRGTHWVVFEPNDEPLWAKIRLNVGAFMMRLFRQGAFQGTSPRDAFFVKCDAETTPQADRDLGIVNIVVGFAPLKPAEFVIITIQQIAGDL